MASASSPATKIQTTTTAAPVKKKRNLPGNPIDPDAEVIALSPTTLMATNRFVCEVCSKGFPREQNLQLHRRGHNLPWKLRQKSGKEVQRRRVYLCPEPTCVHHHPSRALGDLTGIKKHFFRKHGEKKWKCEKCSKRYAVQSDWKAHSKTCGTKEYRCDCGTLFSRRDSFITHRAFCDALAQESSRISSTLNTIGRHHHHHLYGNASIAFNLSQPSSQIASLHNQTNSSTDLLRLGGGGSQFDHLISPSNTSAFLNVNGTNQDYNGLMQLSNNFQIHSNPTPSSTSNLYSLDFFSNGNANAGNQNSQMVMPEQFNFAGDAPSFHNDSLLSPPPPPPPQMSATALLEKATQLSATTSKTGMENDRNLQDLMYLLYGRSHSEQEMDLGSYDMDGFKPQTGNILRGSDQLTRDFLGVGGGVMRSMANGLSQSSLDPDVKSSSRSFGGGNLQ